MSGAVPHAGVPAHEDARARPVAAWLREAHRWLSIVFTLAVVANLAAQAMSYRETWVGIMALVPLILLMVSGLYPFVRPYLSARR